MIIGIDPGERRVGIAIADNETRFARPLEVIDTRDTEPVARIVALIAELSAEKLVVGRPVSLSGAAGPAVAKQQELVVALEAATDIEIIEYDERLTSVIADRALRDAGKNAKNARAIRDAIAAQVLLQGYLDSTA
ncbi:MAG: putative pre6S rRNA nuclease [Actinomycetota bacterium]|jgi:putative Holliday junction resolvase|nr:putative pre6S rRNA nuclease [Actinomycetota bacterium]